MHWTKITAQGRKPTEISGRKTNS